MSHTMDHAKTMLTCDEYYENQARNGSICFPNPLAPKDSLFQLMSRPSIIEHRPCFFKQSNDEESDEDEETGSYIMENNSSERVPRSNPAKTYNLDGLNDSDVDDTSQIDEGSDDCSSDLSDHDNDNGSTSDRKDHDLKYNTSMDINSGEDEENNSSDSFREEKTDAPKRRSKFDHIFD